MLTKSLLKISLVALTTIVSFPTTALSEITQPSLEIAQAETNELEQIAKAITVEVHVGKHKGSGILIAKDNNIYTVVTNAHVANRADTVVVETPDGVKHTAGLMGETDTDQDLALLQFESSNSYSIAEVGSSERVNVDETVIAAGFPYNSNTIKITAGEVSLLPDKSLQGGYQIGFSNETVQGMSGGVLLDSEGKVIGVLGKGKEAIDTNSYTYTDGTNPDAEKLEQYKNASFSIPIANIIQLDSSLASILPDTTVAQSTTAPSPQKEREYTGIVGKVDQVAQQITVRIDNKSDGSNGSGVIIARDGNIYYVATAKHVLCTELDTPECNPTGEQQIVTPDGETHQLDYSRVQAPQVWLDVAVLEFDSANDYQVATLGNYRTQTDAWVFVSGFPHTENHTSGIRSLTGGVVSEPEETVFLTKDNYSLNSNGRGLLYSSISYPGMSGGAVLDTQGRIIGINTGGEVDYTIGEAVNLGFSLGVPIQDFLALVKKGDLKLDSELLKVETTVAPEISDEQAATIPQQLLTVSEPTEDSVEAWLNYGNLLWRYDQFKIDEAIQAFETAIRIEPNLAQAYYGLGLVWLTQKKFEPASVAFKKATEIDPKTYHYWRWLGVAYLISNQNELAVEAYNTAISIEPQDFVLYALRSAALERVKRYEEAIDSLTQAANLYPNHPGIYNMRGRVYIALQEYELALADLNQALEIDPQYVSSYANRAIVYYQQQQYELALADLNQALEIDPQFAEMYNIRGLVYSKLQQYESALADLNQALEIDPQYAYAYHNRGGVYHDLKQYKQALADYNQALEIDPQLAEAYVYRASVYYQQKQYELALADFNQAIEIEPELAEIYYGRGTVYISLQQYQPALADFNQAIEIDQQYANAYLLRGIVYSKLGNLTQTEQDWEQAAVLYQEQNKIQEYQQVQQLLKQLETAQAQP